MCHTQTNLKAVTSPSILASEVKTRAARSTEARMHNQAESANGLTMASVRGRGLGGGATKVMKSLEYDGEYRMA